MLYLLVGTAVLLLVLLLTGTVAGAWFVIGIPVILVGGLFFILRSAREETAGVTDRPEPTGRPRGGTGDGTANERVGQA